MKKSAAYVLLLVLLLIFASVLCIVRLLPESDKKADATTTPVSQVNTAEPTAPPSDTPEETQGDLPTPPPETPTPTPTSTPSPTVTPLTTVSSGSFSSNTGTSLNLAVSWTARALSDGNVSLLVEIGVSSYSFITDALPHSITLSIGGTDYTLSSASVRYEGDSLVVNPIASYTVTLPAGTGTEVSVLWSYRGAYGDVELESITASDTISF